MIFMKKMEAKSFLKLAAQRFEELASMFLGLYKNNLFKNQTVKQLNIQSRKPCEKKND